MQIYAKHADFTTYRDLTRQVKGTFLNISMIKLLTLSV